ncbi:MAG TPA: bifunctional hydroxymethylpyrimidine kinase/phosphomethylpyrimidine kinase [Bryobacteraceae bacterium]|nr:bifunctional hydroxymethylpyrimidine kinase/phosphomethylpyrimidine kinase [Bryobacteraceae bacterium]
MPPIALTIAGSDPSGGAGIQADLKTFHQLGVYGACAITALTVQNTVRASRTEVVEPTLVRQQIDAVLDDLPPDAVKTGALGSAAIVTEVVKAIKGRRAPLIVDPVAMGKRGSALLDADGFRAVRELLIPLAALITPNLEEAERLTDMPLRTIADMREAGERIAKLGAAAVLVKGGHLMGDATDVLFLNGRVTEFRAERIASRHTHGTGCAYSAAITAFLARGLPVEEAVRRAKAYVTEAIRTAPGLGSGEGPLNHWAEV